MVRRAALAGVAGALALGVSACGVSQAYRDANGQVTATATVGLSSLRVGDCVKDVSTLTNPITTMQVLPCSSSHEGEVVGAESNVANVSSDIVNFCTDQFALYVGIDVNSSSLTVNYFSSADASASTTDVECIAFMPGQMVTKSYKDSGQ